MVDKNLENKNENLNEEIKTDNANKKDKGINEVNNNVDHGELGDLTDTKKATKNVDELLEKYDLDSSKLRKLSGKTALLVTVVAILMSAFHLFTAARGTLLAMQQRSLHLIFAFSLGFALYPGFKKSSKNKIDIPDWILIILSIVVWGYIFTNIE